MDLAMMKDMAMTTEDGNTVLTYGINTDNMNSFLNGIVGDMDTLYNGYTVSYNIRSASGKAIVDENGYYVKEDMSLDMDMVMTDSETGESETVSYVMEMHMNINNPGQEVKFELPSTEGLRGPGQRSGIRFKKENKKFPAAFYTLPGIFSGMGKNG